jgi:hypothetical protein
MRVELFMKNYALIARQGIGRKLLTELVKEHRTTRKRRALL